MAALVLLAPSAGAQGSGGASEGPGLDPAVARTAFEQAAAIAAADGGGLWGLSLDFPILFVDPDTRRVVANRADASGELSERHGLWTGQYGAVRVHR